MKTAWKDSIRFVLPLIPIAAAAGYFTMVYQLSFIDDTTLALAIEQLGSMGALFAVYIVQTVGYAVFCGFFGHCLAVL